MTEWLDIEVAYARPDKQLILSCRVPQGTTAAEAVSLSGICGHFPEISEQPLKLGIFGKAVADSQPLRQQDRVEIYRPLIADPKAVRRQRAEAGKAMKKGGGADLA